MDFDAHARARIQVLGLVSAVIAALALVASLLIPAEMRVSLGGPTVAPLAGPARLLAALMLGAASFLGILLFAVARSRGLGTTTLVRIGLFFEVVGALVLSTQSLLVYQAHTRAGLAWADTGPTLVGVWVIVLAAAVQAPWPLTLLASLLSIAVEPALFLLHQQLAPSLEPDLTGLLWTFKENAACALLAAAVARAITGLRRRSRDTRASALPRLETRLDRGQGVEVWKAHLSPLARPVAVRRILPRDLASIESGNSPAWVEEWMRGLEGRATASTALQSPHTATVLAYGRDDDGAFYVATELLEGLDLETLVRTHGPLPSERVAYLLGQICHSLHDAHVHAMVHGDLAPARVLVCAKGIELDFVKVLGYGLGMPLLDGDTRDSGAPSPHGSVVGTPGFMAPEQAAAQEADPRSDVYALGCLATWMLTGERVFEGTTVEMLAQHLRDDPPSLRARTEAAIDPDLEQIVLECLERDPQRRPSTARRVGQLLADTALATRWTEERCERWWSTHAPRFLVGASVATTTDDGIDARIAPGEEAPKPVSAGSEPTFFRRRASRKQTPPSDALASDD